MTRTDGTKFVVLSAQRSGSTWFVDVLNHLGTTVFTELLLPRKKAREQRLMSWSTAEYLDRTLRAQPLYCETRGGRMRVRPLSLVAYLNEVYRRPGPVGFKLMYSNVRRYPEVWAYVALRRLHVVHLVRRNHLDVVISEEMRWATRTVHRILDEPAGPQPQIELEPSGLLRRLRRLRRNVERARWLLRASRVPHLEVTYESVVQDDRGFDRVAEFLAIDRQGRAPRSRLAKLVRGERAAVVRNYAEVRRALGATEFASLLD